HGSARAAARLPGSAPRQAAGGPDPRPRRAPGRLVVRAPQMVVTVPLGEPVRSVPADPRFVSARAFFRLGDAVVGSAPVPIVGDRARSADLADAAVSECAEYIAEE